MTSIDKSLLTLNISFLVDNENADAADVTTPFADALAALRAGWIGVSAADTHVKHLHDGVLVGTDLSKSIGTPGGINDPSKPAGDSTCYG